MAETWWGVELRHLAALSAIDHEQSFRGAADRLGYVQSAVSQQISQLEALVGTRLVDRTRGHAPPVRLTEAGRLLLDHARRIRGQLDAAQADLRTLASGETQALRVGVVPSVASRLLPAILLALSSADPPPSVTIEEASSDRTHFERVARGELDAAFAELPLDPGEFEAVEILVDPCVLLVAVGDPLAAPDATVGLADIAARPLVSLGGWPLLEQIEASLRSAGHEPRVVMHADTNATVQALVGAGVGSAIVPRLAVSEGDPSVAVLDLTDVLPPRRLALYWHGGRRRLAALERFCRAAREAATDVARGYGQGRGAARDSLVLSR